MRGKNYKKADKAKALLELVDQNTHSMSYSEGWHAIDDAVALAIGLQMEWTEDDVGRFAGSDGQYALAIIVNNQSYLRAHEKYKEMAPYFANNVRFPYCNPCYVHVVSGRARSRLCVGAWVVVPDVGEAEVTTMTPEHIILTVSRRDGESHRRKVKRRIKLTHDQCAEMFPAAKTKVTAVGGYPVAREVGPVDGTEVVRAAGGEVSVVRDWLQELRELLEGLGREGGVALLVLGHWLFDRLVDEALRACGGWESKNKVVWVEQIWGVPVRVDAGCLAAWERWFGVWYGQRRCPGSLPGRVPELCGVMGLRRAQDSVGIQGHVGPELAFWEALSDERLNVPARLGAEGGGASKARGLELPWVRFLWREGAGVEVSEAVAPHPESGGWLDLSRPGFSGGESMRWEY